MSASSSSILGALPPISSVVTVRLTHENHMMWKAQFLTYLRTHQLLGIVNGDEAAPAKTVVVESGTGDDRTTSRTTNTAYVTCGSMGAAGADEDQAILGGILATVSEDILSHVMAAVSAAEAWGQLERMFASRSRARLNQIRAQLAMPKRAGMTGTAYFKLKKTLADTLASIGHPLQADEVVAYILSGLGSEYESLVAALNVKADLTLDDVYAYMMGYEHRQEVYQAEPQIGSSSSANFAGSGRPQNQQNRGGQGQGNQGGGRTGGGGQGNGNWRGRGNQGGQGQGGGGGRHGGGGGNWRRGNQGGGGAPRPPCQLCGKPGHMALKCHRRFDCSFHGEEEHPSANIAGTNAGYQVDPNWYSDTGATDHITSDLDRLAFRERYNGTDNVQVGNGAGTTTESGSSAPTPPCMGHATDSDPEQPSSPAQASRASSPARQSTAGPSGGLSDSPAHPSTAAGPPTSSAAPGPAPADAPAASTARPHTRSRSGIVKKLERTDGTVTYACQTVPPAAVVPAAPSGYSEAARHVPWKLAMDDEMAALHRNGTWRLVPFRPGLNVIDSKWIYKLKFKADGSVDRYKARLVAKGFKQREGIDYDDTFSPVVKHTTIRVLLSLAVANNWSMRQLDVQNAFLHGILDEEVYMFQPPGYVDSRYPHHICKLQKSLYGLKQAPRAWFARLSSRLLALGFSSSVADVSLFIFRKGGLCIYFLIYVDDIIVISSSSAAIDRLLTQLRRDFAIKDLGALNYFLGIEVHVVDEGLALCQRKYILDLLQKANMGMAKSCTTPMAVTERLSKDSGTVLAPAAATMYRSIVGALHSLELLGMPFPCRMPRSGGSRRLKILKVMVRLGMAMALELQGGGFSEPRFVDFPSVEGLPPIKGVCGGVAAARRRHVLFFVNVVEV
ncbi:hypothetical protein QYE76_010074 [Lolium multiflorum]|uniref:CCHC-type domain-containing protein n=1 Tax=Lolium multiflorum TaxID=4521 RepID=A0AAD8X3Z8_LOLMU|nr:hypothetical protein QYE76_010074 [Lolium multiflorum]